MSEGIEDLNDGTPSLLEIRDFVVETMRSALDEEEWDERRFQAMCNDLCRDLFYLIAGDRGALHVLTECYTPAEFAEMEEDLGITSQLFRQPIEALRSQMEAWVHRFWTSAEACDVLWHPFAREADRMVLSVLTTDDRQRILAAYGEST